MISQQQLVVFTLDSESYGVDISKVSGIERMQEITRVPRTPEFVEGVINLRGRVIPVVHLRKLFFLSEGEITKETRIVVVDIDGEPIGVHVDEVTEVLTIPTDSVEPPSSVITSADSDYLLGIAKLEGRMIILLDLDKVLSGKQSADLAGMSIPTIEQVSSDKFTEEVAQALEEDTAAEIPRSKSKTSSKKSG
jgi:purine-binding chemotaxis protein CheW